MKEHIIIPSMDYAYVGLHIYMHPDGVGLDSSDNTEAIYLNRHGVEKLKDLLETWLDGQESRGQ